MKFALVVSLRNHGTDRVASQPPSNTRVAVALVASDALRTSSRASRGLRFSNGVQRFFELHGFVDLASGDMAGEGKACAVSNQVELGPESAARAAESVVCGLFGSPFIFRSCGCA